MTYTITEQNITDIGQALFQLNVGIKDHTAIINLLKSTPLSSGTEVQAEDTAAA